MNRNWPTVAFTGICIDVQFGEETKPEIGTEHLWPILLRFAKGPQDGNKSMKNLFLLFWTISPE
jgi:hypothetical protein